MDIKKVIDLESFTFFLEHPVCLGVCMYSGCAFGRSLYNSLGAGNLMGNTVVIQPRTVNIIGLYYL